jgi:hypothetical protein
MREGQCIECFADGDALKECVPLLRVYRALFVHDLLVFRVVVP